MHKPDLIRTLKSLDALSQDQKAYLIDLVNTKKKYGLVWEDKPEDVEELLRQHLPVLSEVPERRILAVAQQSTPAKPAPAPIPKNAAQGTLAFTKTDESNPTPTDELPSSEREGAGGGPSHGEVEVPNHLLIEGDNLHALTALTFTHQGRVDVIYIDPPYNTGNKDFKYNDRFVDREDAYRHSKWLSFMHKRLLIAKRLLADTGVIFISIDDNEQAQLKMLCDEVFGEENFVAELIWEKGKKGDSKFFSVTHEYILVYVSSKIILLEQNVRWRKKKAGLDEVLAKYQELKSTNKENHTLVRKAMMEWFNSLSKDDPRKKNKHYNHSDDRGLYFADNFAGPDDGRLNRPRYDIIHPVTGQPCSKPSTGWRWDESTTLDALAQNPPRIHFGKDETTIPCRKSYLFEIDSEPFQSVFYKDGRSATLQVEELVGKGKFKFPKDTEILGSLIALNSERDSIILDFFAGSGTTLHATMQLNAEDGGTRQCILVTNNENNIAEEVCYERNKRVIQGYTNAKGQQVPGLTNNNLRYYRCETVPRQTTLPAKRLLMQRATELLCIKEGLYHEVPTLRVDTQIRGYGGGPASGRNQRYLLIIYDDLCIDEAVTLIRQTVEAEPDARFRVYVFSNGQYPYTEEFEEVLPYVTLCALPDALYKAYRQVLPAEQAPVRLADEEAAEVPDLFSQAGN